MRIGIDIIEVDRFRRLKEKDYDRWQRVFSPREWKHAFRDARRAQSLAGIFAAKEAVMKATGKTEGANFRKIEVSHTLTGAPKVNLPKVAISISHTPKLAVGVAVFKP